MWDIDWRDRARCRDQPPDLMFVDSIEQHEAKRICVDCSARTECLADALDNEMEFGVWGGLTERERRAVLARRPDVRSWRRLLEKSREQRRNVADRTSRQRSIQPFRR